MKLYVIDGSGFIFRAYHGLPPLTDKDGNPVHAVFGFFRMIFRMMLEKPEGFVIAWDAPVKTIRHEMYEDYKANRPSAPDDLKYQIKLIKRLVEELKIPYNLEKIDKKTNTPKNAIIIITLLTLVS